MSSPEHKGTLFIICAPSGAGKSSLVRALVDAVPDLAVSISHTTRPPRASEKHGVDYFFVGEDEFQTLLEQNTFLEHATVFDHLYGTSQAWVQEQLADGKDIILEIDWQGAQQVRSIIKDTVNIFILPPSLASLAERLKGRGDEKPIINRRMRDAVSEIEHYGEFDYLVVNHFFDRTLKQLSAIVLSARHDYHRHRDYFEALLRQLLH
jgi:guanylate kinase